MVNAALAVTAKGGTDRGLTKRLQLPILTLILPAFRQAPGPSWNGGVYLFVGAGTLTRVAVFIDYQNVYNGARDAFGWRSAHFTLGQVLPRRLGVLLTDRGRVVEPARDLEKVMVFRGEPLPNTAASARRPASVSCGSGRHKLESSP